jgi:CBS domain containing-hemolysin-like protein
MEREQAVKVCSLLLGAVAALASGAAHASFLSGDALDTMADILAIVVLLVVPAIAIVLFWIVHVMPEKIAHKRHHPQTEAITTLCLLSLVFGGLLWPLAWLWAYTKPVGYRMAYGTDKHEGYFDEMAEKHREGKLVREEARHLSEELEAMEARGALPPRFKTLKDELARLRAEADARERAAANAAKADRAA